MNMDEVLDSPLAGVICEKPFYDAVFTNSPTGIILTDTTGKFLDVNEMCAQILGYSRSELIGKTFQELTHQEDILYDMRMFNHLLRGEGESYEMVKRFVRKGGGVVWVKVKANAVREDGQFTHTIRHIVELEKYSDSNAFLTAVLRDKRVKVVITLLLSLVLLSFAASAVSIIRSFMR